MIKRTLYFGNPSYLSIKNAQLNIRLPEVEKNDLLPTEFKRDALATIPVEDIGIVVIDNPQITLTSGLLQALQENNVAVIICDYRHMPQSLLLPIEGNSIQQERYDAQLAASEPLKKQLWQQTVTQKIKNQAAALDSLELQSDYLIPLHRNVKSGDTDNCEATAAVYYWQTIFRHVNGFVRHREGPPPNNFLNYGYAILRATMARSIVAAGLLPTLGIFHKNFATAKDINVWYHIDKTGNEIYRQRFLAVEPFYNGFALVTQFDNDKIIIDENGKTTLKIQ